MDRVHFINDITQGDAERVPRSELDIPHRGVYHPKSGKILVVLIVQHTSMKPL